MKKLDLHIHTIQTLSDPTFIFDLDNLANYVRERSLDGIAITNHNKFDLNQYREIREKIPKETAIMPGIEINIGDNAGHILLIADDENLEDFSAKCLSVENQINSATDSISAEELKEYFPDLNRYLLIPHYEKKPAVSKQVIEKLREYISCGEVGSIKKFVYCQKDASSFTPVYFSDYRPVSENTIFSTRQTYVDVDELTVAALKKTFLDKSKVTLSAEEGNHIFNALPELPLSTGLNVIIGGRSSGKTYTLNRLEDNYANVKYIKQFALLEKNPTTAESDFIDKISAKQSSIAEEYFSEFYRVVDEIKDISQKDNEFAVEQYLTSLIRHAKEIERLDLYAKCKLYVESKYSINDLSRLKELIESVEKLLDEQQYKEIIECYLSREKLIGLHKALIERYYIEKQEALKKTWVNDVVEDIKRHLQARTSATKVEDVDFYQVMLDREKIATFNKIATNIKQDAVINEKEIEGFKIQVRKVPFNGAGEMKTFSKRVLAFSNVFPLYKENPYQFLLGLKEIDTLSETEYYKYFAKVEYKILNEYGFEVSGGERAEFNLLQEINDAYRYDMLLIDEPESSFDNIFLREKVNHIIKKIAMQLPVVIVTHNSTVGASIQPDFVIHTRRVIENKNVHYEVYYGMPSSKYLVDNNGNKIKNLDVTLDCLEAGEVAYDERRREYEVLRN